MDPIIEYIKETYAPFSIIVYGSYADGSNNQNSDFDALVISERHDVFHDTSLVGGIQLDVFVYPASYFDNPFDCDEFIQIFDGKIVLDTDQKGVMLKNRILSYIDQRPCKTNAEIQAAIDWCVKMLARTKKNDAEGMFRWHWVLVDSLEIFCDAVHHPYWGPKKTLTWMEKNDPEAFSLYQAALFHFRQESLQDWISYLKQMI